MALEVRGVPTVVVCTEAFMDAAAAHAATYGCPQARVVAIEHPLAAISPQEVIARADAVIKSLVAQLLGEG